MKIKEKHVHNSAFVLCFLDLISYSQGVSKNGNEKIGTESYFLFYIFAGGSDSKASACNAGDPGSISGLENSLDKEMATHSSILAWRIPWTEELW